MSKFLKAGVVVAAVVGSAVIADIAESAEIAEGEKVFRKCAACHTVGEDAKSRVGPHLNDLFGRTAGTVDGFKYSAAMVAAGEGGLAWDEQSLTQFLVKPREVVSGTKMAFAGLRKSVDVANVLAYLKTFDADMAATVATDEAPEEASAAAETEETPAQPAELPSADHDGPMKLGRLATEDEIAAWDIDIRPDGLGLPPGRGTVAQGEPIYTDNCAVCHGDFGEGIGRWPVLAGGQDTLTNERPIKTVGSYWPYLSTVYDYIRRAMPFGNARSLTDDEVYALTAYVLYLNDIVDDEEFELSPDNFTEIGMPNEDNFIPDTRPAEEHYAEKTEPCMSDCKPGPVKITMRAQVLDVTPDGDEEGGGAID
ncbi:c-type cytochrome [Oricola cellulosilytica]|uniref:C-type cytochrome n=1 Tax=Oricola cellulosilytica TaxID=1429082 RepID=A0A4R0P7U1_9HYPH|nr:c-type cytochrome [Oricola cellulosilytica]TCD11949.1 c-type cytochrome [Oricola cellulosilytica]